MKTNEFYFSYRFRYRGRYYFGGFEIKKPSKGTDLRVLAVCLAFGIKPDKAGKLVYKLDNIDVDSLHFDYFKLFDYWNNIVTL